MTRARQSVQTKNFDGVKHTLFFFFYNVSLVMEKRVGVKKKQQHGFCLQQSVWWEMSEAGLVCIVISAGARRHCCLHEYTPIANVLHREHGAFGQSSQNMSKRK